MSATAVTQVSEAGKQAPPPWSERLRDLLLPVLKHKIERFGIDTTGAYNFYKARAQSGQIFMEYEIELTRRILSSGLGIRHVHEIGSGFGQLMFLMGWNGFRTLGFEADRARAQTARDLRAMLDLVDPQLTENVQLVEGEFPSREGAQPTPGSLVLTTNLVATRSLAQQLDTLGAMRKYPFVLSDMQRFFDLRLDPAQEPEALALFAQAGFKKPELFLDLGTGGRYYLFTNPA